MRQAGLSFAGVAVVVLAGLVLLSNAGLVSMNLPGLPDIASHETEVSQATEARIVQIQPITLDCRARIKAQVPLEGRKQHKAFGQTYRTDHVSMEAVGDIDTCVEAAEVQIVERGDGSVQVIVPADAVRFERPRVDAIATLDSVRFSKGWVGKITDVAPWVSENSGLTPSAYAYAQSVIGSSECMAQAWSVTERAMIDAYVAQMEAADRPEEAISVQIVGVPDFGHAEFDPGDFEFEVKGSGTLCSVDRDAYDVPLEEPADAA